MGVSAATFAINGCRASERETIGSSSARLSVGTNHNIGGAAQPWLHETAATIVTDPASGLPRWSVIANNCSDPDGCGDARLGGPSGIWTAQIFP